MTSLDDRLWNQFRYSSLWRLLKKVEFLRSGFYLAIELGRIFEPQMTGRDLDQLFTTRDPFKYETDPLEKARFADQTAVLDEIREGRSFQSGLEIGCAEGLYTEVLAARCESLLVLDFSATALERTKNRRNWPERVRFGALDLERDPIPGTYDLIVVAGVLEYFKWPSTVFKVREKLTGVLRSSGYLLCETTRVNPVVEDSWWGRRLIRGKWINVFISDHPSLTVIHSIATEAFCITLCRKSPASNAP